MTTFIVTEFDRYDTTNSTSKVIEAVNALHALELFTGDDREMFIDYFVEVNDHMAAIPGEEFELHVHWA